MSSSDRPRKVAFVVGFYPIERGGAEYQAYLLAQALKNDFKIIFISCGEAADGFFEKDGFEVYTVNSRNYRGIRYGLFRLYRRVLSILERIDPDVVYQRIAGPATAAAGRYSTKHGKKFIWHIASEANVRPLPRSIRNVLQLRLLEKKLVDYGIRRATSVIAQARYQCDFLKRHYNRDCDAVVLNFHPLPKVQIEKSKLLTIVWISNLKYLKRPDLFLDLAEMLKDRDDIRMIMVGRQTMPAIVDRLANAERSNRNFEYAGELTQEQISGLLARAHILVNTSEFEGFPNTFVQAWLHQVPVVSLNVDPDAVLSKRGLGICSGSMPVLHRDVRRLLDDTRLREDMGRRAVHYAQKHHSIENAKIVANFFKRQRAD